MYNTPYNYFPYVNMPRNISQTIPFNNINNFPANNKNGLFKGFSNIKWTDVLNNTQKTLNVINQAIPIYYQIKPIFNNVKNFSHLLSAFNSDDDSNKQINNNLVTEATKKENSTNSPTFFIS